MMEIRCDKCKRYLGESHGTIVATIKCSNSKCKKDVQIKRVNNDTLADIRYKFINKTETKK